MENVNAIEAPKAERRSVGVLVPVAEIREDCIINLRKQPDGSRWPVGTKLYAIDTAAVAEATSALRDVDHVITQWRESGREPAYGQWLTIQDVVRAALANVGSAS